MQPRLDDRVRARAVVAAFPGHGFALIDGAHFVDVSNSLAQAGLLGRSLFLDQADVEIRNAGPWLIGLDQAPDAADRVFDLVAEKPAVIFWCCSAGESFLYRHLRTLTMARIPRWATNGTQTDDMDGYDLVFFRHFDPRVLGALLPTLDAPQLARFLGPCEEIAFRSIEFGLKRMLARDVVSAPSRGPLTINSDQLLQMSERRATASHRKICLYLRKHAPEQTADIEDDELLETVSSYVTEARALGARSEASFGVWCYLQATSDRDLSRDATARVFLNDRAHGMDTDARIHALLLARNGEV